MATSGSNYSTFGTNSMYRFYIAWTRDSYNIANNTSTVTVRAYIQSMGSSYTINSSAAKSGSMTINGSTYSFTFYCGVSGNGTREVFSKQVTIAHNADGTKSFNMSATGTIGISFSSGKVNDISVSCTGTLDTLPRTSSMSLSTSTATLGSTTVTVNITRASTSFTHNVYFVYGNRTVGISSSAGTSASFVPPLDLSSMTPNATQGWGTVFVETYSGGTHIGTTSAGLTCYVPASVKPSFSSLGAEVVDAGAPTSYGYVQGKSKCRLSIWGAAGSYGSSITSYVIERSDGYWNQWQVTTGVLYAAGSITYSAYVIDSRGRASDRKTVTITVNAYEPPKITGFSNSRCLSTGTIAENGTYVRTWGTFTHSSLGGKNTVSAQIQYKLSTHSGWTVLSGIQNNQTLTLGNGNLNTANAYDIILIVTDNFTTVTRTARINPSYVTLDFKAGGTGIAIGKQASVDWLFDIGLVTEFAHPLKEVKGHYVHEAWMNGASQSAIKIANFSIVGEWINQPIELTIMQRGIWKATKFYIEFSGDQYSANQRIVSFHKEGPGQAYISGNAGAYDLFIPVTGTWDVVSVVDMYLPPYLRDNVNISWMAVPMNVPNGSIPSTDVNLGNNWDGRSLFVRQDGVVEVGKYLDFHAENTNTSDYDGRITAAGWALTLNQPFIPAGGNFNLGHPDSRWHTLYSVGGVNTSSDRTLKENISYINSKSRTADQITYSDMYNFIKDDLGLAEYNLKNDEKKTKKLNFIAQDILANADGSDNVIGQLIVNPVSVPTRKEMKEAKAKLEDGEEYRYPTLSFDTVTYISVIAGALKEAINKIEELTIKIEELENKAGDDNDIYDC